jgi:hypothetical protein
MSKEFKTYDNTILVEGKKYRWSGFKEGLYWDNSWKYCKCKIRKIEGDKIFIYDYDDMKEYDYDNNGLSNLQITFKRNNLKTLINFLINEK